MTGVFHTTLVLGGARSGKTQRALALAEPSPKRIYLATAEARDDEMAERIKHHQRERDATWSTIEAPLDVADALVAITDESACIVVDCLTIWLSNLMHHERDVGAESARLIAAAVDCNAPVVLVSNEVGFGIVPENALARGFRDAQGRLNQEVAAAVDCVEFIAAGIPLRLKPAVAT